MGEYKPDSLLIGEDYFTDSAVLQVGQSAKRGSVLSKVKFSIPTTGTAGTNTGNGTLTLVRGSKHSKIGTYTVKVLKVVASAFCELQVLDPNSQIVGGFMIGIASTEYGDYYSDQISFRVTSGTTAFVANDTFTIAVSIGVPTTGSATAGNTGSGTLIQVESRRSLKKGKYTITCTQAIANGGKFSVVDPDGIAIGSTHCSKFTGTGNGTVTEIKAGPAFKADGSYKIVCTTAVANGGVFSITDPTGVYLGSVTITPGAGASAVFTSDQISFRITDGGTDFLVNAAFELYWFENNHICFVIWDATDFVVGDSFSVTTTIANNEMRLVDQDNTDGSTVAECILAEDTDASLAPKRIPIYVGGLFDERSLFFGGNDTIEDHRAGLRSNGIYTQRSVKY